MLTYSQPLPLASLAPDFELKGTDERFYQLGNFTRRKGVLIVFTCNHCEYAQAAWPLLIELYDKHHRDIYFVAINPNSAVLEPADSFTEMREEVLRWDLPFPYLHDQSQATAKAYNAVCTPDPYLFSEQDNQFWLFYHGRINNNWQNRNAVQEHSLADAMQLLIAGEKAPEDQQPSMGCSIKWAE